MLDFIKSLNVVDWIILTIGVVSLLYLICAFVILKSKGDDDFMLCRRLYRFELEVRDFCAIIGFIASVFLLGTKYYTVMVVTPEVRETIESNVSAMNAEDFSKWFTDAPEAYALAEPLPNEVKNNSCYFDEDDSIYHYAYSLTGFSDRITFTVKEDGDGSNILEWE